MSIERLTVEELNKQNQYMNEISSVTFNKFYYIDTMGCQLNENDSEKLAGMAEKMGYIVTDKFEQANLVIFNTCCIRENAEKKVFGKLGALKNIKKEKKEDCIIVICGCMAQEGNIVKVINEKYRFVDIIFGTHTLYKFPELMYNLLKSKKKILDVVDIDGNVIEGLPICRNNKYRANVTIIYGCNNFCSYCIVPYVRGRQRSRNMNDIINEIEQLAKDGYKEVTLLGQNVNSYGLDLDDENATFANLLYKVNEIDGIDIIKFISPHPKDFTDDVIEAINKCRKVHRVIHLPLQSGSTNILAKMNRKYTKEQYLQLAEKIKKVNSDIVFTTDVIVGFPGETEEDFLDTLDVISKVKFDQVYMFIYSRRFGTVADKMDNQIDEVIKGERLQRVKDLVSKIIEENNNEYIGKEVEILVEGYSKYNDNVLTGRTNTGKIVNFEGTPNLIGSKIKVKIIKNHLWYLDGILKTDRI